jgi:hypothetical protein
MVSPQVQLLRQFSWKVKELAGSTRVGTRDRTYIVTQSASVITACGYTRCSILSKFMYLDTRQPSLNLVSQCVWLSHKLPHFLPVCSQLTSWTESVTGIFVNSFLACIVCILVCPRACVCVCEEKCIECSHIHDKTCLLSISGRVWRTISRRW